MSTYTRRVTTERVQLSKRLAKSMIRWDSDLQAGRESPDEGSVVFRSRRI